MNKSKICDRKSFIILVSFTCSFSLLLYSFDVWSRSSFWVVLVSPKCWCQQNNWWCSEDSLIYNSLFLQCWLHWLDMTLFKWFWWYLWPMMTFSKLSVILAVATHFSLAHTASPVNEGEIWMMKWTHKLLQLFGLLSDPPPPPPHPPTSNLIHVPYTQYSHVYAKKCVYFSKEQSWLICKQILMNQYLEQELAPYQTDQKMHTLPNWVSDIFWSINRGHIWKMDFEWSKEVSI